MRAVFGCETEPGHFPDVRELVITTVGDIRQGATDLTYPAVRWPSTRFLRRVLKVLHRERLVLDFPRRRQYEGTTHYSDGCSIGIRIACRRGLRQALTQDIASICRCRSGVGSAYRYY